MLRLGSDFVKFIDTAYILKIKMSITIKGQILTVDAGFHTRVEFYVMVHM